VSASKTDVYKDDVIVETIPNKEYEKQNALIIKAAEKLRRQSHRTNAAEPAGFGEFMQQRLASYFRPYINLSAGTAIIITFTVTEDGKPTNGKSLTSVSDDVQRQVARAIDVAPYWTPAESNGRPISQNITYTFVLDNSR
jgi:hypothetical protein